MARVLLVFPERDFSVKEARWLPRAFQEAGIGVDLACGPVRGYIFGPSGYRVGPCRSFHEVMVRDYAAVIFVGGRGARQYWDDPMAQALAREAQAAGSVIGASRQAAIILAKAGLLNGRRATTTGRYAGQLQRAGAQYTATEVQVDDGLITLRSSRGVPLFARTIVDLVGRRLAA